MNRKFKRALSSILAFVMVMSCMIVMNVGNVYAAEPSTVTHVFYTTSGDTNGYVNDGNYFTVARANGNVGFNSECSYTTESGTEITHGIKLESETTMSFTVDENATAASVKVVYSANYSKAGDEANIHFSGGSIDDKSSELSAGKTDNKTYEKSGLEKGTTYQIDRSTKQPIVLYIEVTETLSGDAPVGPTPGESTTEASTEASTEAEPDVEISTEKVEIATVETKIETGTVKDTGATDDTPIEVTTDDAGNYYIKDDNKANTANLTFSFPEQSKGIVRISGEATQPNGKSTGWTFAQIGNSSKNEVFGIRVLGGNEKIGGGSTSVDSSTKSHLGLRVDGNVQEGSYGGGDAITDNGTKISYELIINYYDSKVTLIANGKTVAENVSFTDGHSVSHITFVTATAERHLLVSTPTVTVETKPEKVADGVIKYGEQYYVVKGVSKEEVAANSSYVIKATGNEVTATESDNKVYTGVNIAGVDFSASDIFDEAPNYVVGVIISGTVEDAEGLADKYELGFTPINKG